MVVILAAGTLVRLVRLVRPEAKTSGSRARFLLLLLLLLLLRRRRLLVKLLPLKLLLKWLRWLG